MIDLSFLGEGPEAERKKRVLEEYFFITTDLAERDPDEYLRVLELWTPQLLERLIPQKDILKLKEFVTKPKKKFILGRLIKSTQPKLIQDIREGNDIYESKTINQELERNLNQLNGILNRYNITRIVVPFRQPVWLSQLELIVQEVRDFCNGNYNEEQTKAFCSDLEQFLKKEILGVPPFQYKRINWIGPVHCDMRAHNVYAVECWLGHEVWNKRDVYTPLFLGIYGFTDERHTVIDTLTEQMRNLSSAFTYHKGFPYAIAFLYDMLGRNMLKGNISRAEDWLRSIRDMDPYVYYQDDVYSAKPFSIPIDVIFYPHAEEYGATNFFDLRYLKHSLNAKLMFKANLEKITGKEFKVTESLVANLIKREEQK